MPFRLSRPNRSKLLTCTFPFPTTAPTPPPLCSIRLHFFLQIKKNGTVLLVFFPSPSPSLSPNWNCIGPTIYLLITCKGSLWDIGHLYHRLCCFCYSTPHSCITHSHHCHCFFTLQPTLEISSRLALFVLSCTFLFFVCHSSFHVWLFGFCNRLLCE
jgi:hypothetical protein